MKTEEVASLSLIGEEKTHGSSLSVWGCVIFRKRTFCDFSCLISEKAFFNIFQQVS
jgi:hypothetical protein